MRGVSTSRHPGIWLIAGCGTLAVHKPLQKPVGLLFALAYTPRR